MSKKTFQLISGIVGGVQAIAVAVVTYTSPEFATAINGAIVIVGTAVIDDQILYLINTVNVLWKIIQCYSQRLGLIIAGNLNYEFHNIPLSSLS
jgi:hypothetical protein